MLAGFVGALLLLLLLAGFAFVSSSPDAKVSERGAGIVATQLKLTPAPEFARADRGQLHADGCMAWDNDTSSKSCIYGSKNPRAAVALFGDSRAMQYFEPLEPIAQIRRWKITALIKGNCLIADVSYERYCDFWRENSLRRIERERPDLVIVGSATKGMYQLTRDGRQIGWRASQPFIVAGFAATLRRLRATGAKLLVIRDQSMAPFPPPECLLKNPNSFSNCDYIARDRSPRAFELRAARRVGVRVLDPQPIFCPGSVCSAVVAGIVVFRDNYHLTGTFAKTLRPWLAKQLPSRLREQ